MEALDVDLNPDKLKLTCAYCGAQDFRGPEHHPIHRWGIGAGKGTAMIFGATVLCPEHKDLDQLEVAMLIISRMWESQGNE